MQPPNARLTGSSPDRGSLQTGAVGGEDAFTFLEVIVGMAILVSFMAGLFAASGQVMGLLGAQREIVAASQMIQERTEQVRSVTYAQLTDAAYVQATLLDSPTNSAGMLNSLVETLTISAYPPDGSAVLQATRQQGAVTVNSTNPALANNSAVRVDLQLAWTNQGGRGRTRQVSTIVAKGGINP